MKKFLAEFKEFAMRGNVLDMAIGVILATAFGKITTSLVNDVFMPLIGCLFGKMDLSKLNIVLHEATETTEAVTVGIGTFLTAVIDFILVAFVVFICIRIINKTKARFEKPAEPEPEVVPEPTKEELLLTEIRDLLKEKQ